MVEPAWALIIAPPGRLRDSVCVLLRASTKIERIELSDGQEAGWTSRAACPPDLILLDAGALGDQAWTTLLHLRQRWPQCACIVMTHTAGQERQARQAGAGYVLRAGFSAQDLSQMIKTLETPPDYEEIAS